MSVWKGEHACLESGSCLSGKEFMSVLKGVHHVLKGIHACLETGSCLSGKEFMSIW